jgi:hypothetical protein
MKIFLSWSGEVSHKVASVLDSWLPCVIQGAETFISSDINKGDRWNDALTDGLKEAQYGIICVTPYNIHTPWMNFEAGALSNAISRACVMPFLFHVHPDDIDGPLSQFQSTIYEKQDIFNMVHSINTRTHKPLKQELLNKTFEKWWRELETGLHAISVTSQTETRAFYEWLCTREDLDVYIGAAEFKTVWIVTNETERYLDQSMKAQILAACQQGKKFRYFLPRADEYEYQAELDQMVQTFRDNVSFKLFATDEFESQVASDYIICNPDGGGELRVLVKLPFEDHRSQEYWLKTNDRSARSFVARFRCMWDGQKVAAAFR